MPQTTQGSVSSLWRYPVKSMVGEELTATEVTEQGLLGDRLVARWRYEWAGGHVRGVDVFRVRDGRVAEKLSYVKG